MIRARPCRLMHSWHEDKFELKALKNQQVAWRFSSRLPVPVPLSAPPFLPEASATRPTQPFSPAPLPSSPPEFLPAFWPRIAGRSPRPPLPCRKAHREGK